MRHLTPFLILLLATVAVAGDTPSSRPVTSTASIRQALTLALLDEYDARDTYQSVVDRYGPVRPFGNVLAAEENHVSALQRHFRKLGIPLPEPDKKLRAAAASLGEACQAAVEAERENVALYSRLLPMVASEAEIEQTFRRLQAASRDRHLPAFERCAAAEGKTAR
jgi:rubrerythrin